MSTEPTGGAFAVDELIISDDFFQGNIQAGLERIRLRLLDLTNRNRLLNFRHTEKSSLRAVDELLDSLYNVLRDGSELYFAPIPKPPKRTSQPLFDEDAAAKIPSAKEYAETLGINTSYDLPELNRNAAQKLQDRWTDKAIQTLHYPEALESILSKISNTARLAIEETGTNMLYLVFGFLEWYESEAANKPHQAPVLLLPVSLRRGVPDPKTRTYRYYIEYSGEDVLANISLQEKMRKDFNLSIPDLDEEDTPESYFKRLNPVLRLHNRWKLRREVTLTLLSFGKLLMYRDLDPRGWPSGAKISEHPRIKEFFQGIQQKEISFATDYNIDDERIRLTVPPLIDDADSSQHSALIDALSNKSLVIAGPPGTGKSQTITNFIAAALAKGKTVLFVSEKAAALEVVRRRLDNAGLGIFCLELHSNKTRKQELLKDIENRLQFRRRLKDNRDLDGKLQLAESNKQRLSKHVALINSTHGELGISVYDIIWAHQRAVRASRFDPLIINKIQIPDAGKLNAVELGRRRQIVSEFAHHASTILSTVPHPQEVSRLLVVAHPWYGITNDDLTYLEGTELVGRLNSIAISADSIQQAVEKINVEAAGGNPGVKSPAIGSALGEIKNTINSVCSLPPLAEEIIPSLLPVIANGELRAGLEEFCEKVRQCRILQTTLKAAFGAVPAFTVEDTKSLRLALKDLEPFLGVVTTISDIWELARLLEKEGGRVQKSLNQFEELHKNLGVKVSETFDGLKLMNAGLTVIENAPWDILHRRHKRLERDSVGLTLDNALREAEPIIAVRAALDQRVQLHMAPSATELSQYIAACANAGWFSFLNKDFRAAKRAYASISRTPGRHGKQQMWSDFQALSDYNNSLQKFSSTHLYQEVCGPHFNGIDTPFIELRKASIWLEEVRQNLWPWGETGTAVGQAIWELPESRLRLFEKGRRSASVEILREAEEAIHSANSSLPETVKLRPEDPLASIAERLLLVSSRLKEVAALLLSTGLSTDYSIEQIPELIEKHLQVENIKAELASSKSYATALKDKFAGVETDIDLIVNTFEFHDRVVSSALSLPLKEWLNSEYCWERLVLLRAWAQEISGELVKLENTSELFGLLTNLNTDEWYGTKKNLHSASLEDVYSRAQAASKSIDLFSDWLDYLRARKLAVSEGKLEALVSLVEEGAIRPSDLDDAFNLLFYQSLIKEIFKCNPELARFNGMTHEQIRSRFRQMDREVIKLNRIRAAYQIDQRLVPYGNSVGPVSTYTDLALIQREIEKQKRHIPIRQLIHRAGDALQALKPCFMMGPLSVAQYLAPGELTFDYVVMDEASQLKPEDALGAIARAKQVIIVGDRMQLPPTSFFDRIGDEEEEGDDPAQALTEAESILDVASALYRPARLLKWHYRSQHASLIAFSNKEFYRGNLIVFPSPVNGHTDLGVKFIHVSDGIYENRRNMIEANRVIDAVLEHMRIYPFESLGVVTLNAVQRDLIEDEFEQRLKDDPYAQQYMEKMEAGAEPFFIKNLENVQGDERDVIFISVTFGPDKKGNVYQRFGPLNSATGHRRLNVLFTRAKRRVVVFSSMLYSQIQEQPGSAWGLRALKAYLEYAQTGALEQAQFTGREPDSDFEIEVADALRARGYEVVAQVGVAGFFIDLAVKHPTKPGAYVLGIECDGATYHSSRSARDRDRLRQEILERLGWKIHRIWSTDWFKNSLAEANRISVHIESILQNE